MDTILKTLGELGIIPAVTLKHPETAVPLGQALLAGGLPCAEIMFRSDAAAAGINQLSREVPQVLVGAGTVLTTEQAARAMDAGARFIVAPGCNPKVVKYCLEAKMPIIPGICTPTEIEMAMEHGLEILKFFPAEALGGVEMLKAVSAAYSGVRFVPTGGINAANLSKYLALPQVLACGGSWMVKQELIDAGNFAEITRLTAEAVLLRNSMRK